MSSVFPAFSRVILLLAMCMMSKQISQSEKIREQTKLHTDASPIVCEYCIIAGYICMTRSLRARVARRQGTSRTCRVRGLVTLTPRAFYCARNASLPAYFHDGKVHNLPRRTPRLADFLRAATN